MSEDYDPNKALEEYFRPEFLNRLDDIVVFRPLEREDLRDEFGDFLKAALGLPAQAIPRGPVQIPAE